jgi:hypothetical protein
MDLVIAQFIVVEEFFFVIEQSIFDAVEFI